MGERGSGQKIQTVVTERRQVHHRSHAPRMPSGAHGGKCAGTTPYLHRPHLQRRNTSFSGLGVERQSSNAKDILAALVDKVRRNSLANRPYADGGIPDDMQIIFRQGRE